MCLKIVIKSLSVKEVLNILLVPILVTKKMRLLCIFLPIMSAYRRDFDKTKYMSFL